MSEAEKQQNSTWQKPALVKIGSIADVAGRPIPLDQDSLNRKS